MENSKTGRDPRRLHGMGASSSLNHSKDFDALAMLRRLEIFIAHAAHDPRTENGASSPANVIYKRNLRSGWMRFVEFDDFCLW